MDIGSTKLGIGTRLQHTQHGSGVIAGVKYATYLISFIHQVIKEVDRIDPKLEEIIPENITAEVETKSSVEKSLLKILRQWSDTTKLVPLGDRWKGGNMLLQPADKSQKPKEIPVKSFFYKIAMLQNRLRVPEQDISSHNKLSDEDKLNLQQYITHIYGSFTTFNVLFKNEAHRFKGDKRGRED